MRTTLLHDNWSFRGASEGVGYWRPNQPSNPWRPARVPGDIHLDLMAAGVIADPFALEHEAGCQWVSEEDWVYRTTFEWTPESSLPRRILSFEGLDTACTVSLNGAPLAQHDNMFLPLEIDVSNELRAGENELEIVFRSPVKTGMERRRAYFEAEGIDHGTNWFDERGFVRKVQCMSGWDWGPRLPSCGIWQPVELQEFSSRILSFTVFQERLEDGRFRVWSETAVEGDAALTTEFDGNRYEGDFECTVEEPALWWPNGEGQPHLYEAKARLSSGHGVAKRIGLRTIRLVQGADDRGVSFYFEVNGRPIYSRGANWIPNDSFPARISDNDYRDQIKTCADLGMNMLRVWGGGFYEREAFYDACDEFGILVWQDFPFACSYYPDGPEQQNVLRAEAEFHVRRLRDRASLAIWCGNNENDVMWDGKWGGLEKSPQRYFGDCLYGDVLAEVTRRLDPGRPYIRSSPIGGQEEGRAWGDAHYWDVWHGRGDWKFYADSLTRFSSEFGFASACSRACWGRAKIDTQSASRDDLAVRWHDKTNKPWEVYRDLVELHYPACDGLEDWIYFSQLNQRDALRFGIEHYRTNGYCQGTLIWQFNDCWPVQSWAVQDYVRQLKIAGFELRRLYAPVLVSLRVEQRELVVLAANDGQESIQDVASLALFDTEAGGGSDWTWEVRLAPGERKELGRADLAGIDPTRALARARLDGHPDSETWRTLGEPRAMVWVQPKLSIDKNLELTVDGLAYDLTVDDPDSPGNVQFADSTLPGWEAKTIVNRKIKLKSKHAPGRVRCRSMAGMQILEVPPP